MAEKDQSPEWLLSAPNYHFWKITDPKNQNYEITARIRDEVKEKVISLLT
jgi:hypothetical protein